MDQVKGIAKRFNKLNPYNRSIVREILKIEDINHVDSDPRKPYHQLYGYAVSAKRYTLFTDSNRNVSIEKASGHGLGYLFAPKARSVAEHDTDDESEETPEWVFEAWEYLIRKQFRYQPKKPEWLKLPAMMRMVMTTPNVLRDRRPDWLAPFNFFLFPMLSVMGGYPVGFDKSNFHFITPAENDRKKWSALKGINLIDGRTYQISMVPDPKQKKVFPDSFQIILNQYLGKAEIKSLAPDGTECKPETEGLLGRARVVGRTLVPVGKETDRHWDQGGDPSMFDPKTQSYAQTGKLVRADDAERQVWAKFGIRALMRATNLTQKVIYAILSGKGVRPQTMAMFRMGVESLAR